MKPRKKVLVISYYWPPAGGIGVLRTLKIVKYLREYGWEPTVYAPLNANYPYYDQFNEKDVPADLKVLRRNILEPFGLFRKLTGRGKEVPLNNIITVREDKKWFDQLGIWIRGNFFIPDARSLWIKPSVRYLSSYLKQNSYDAIFSDGPPHTNTVIACKISKESGLPWLADFQDPWTQVDYYKHFKISAWADRKHKALEQEAFKQASQITIASPTAARDLESIGAENVDVVYYGYDDDDFNTIKPKADQKFTICHSGILGSDRLTENLFKVLSRLILENEDFKNDFELKLIGQVDYVIKDKLERLGLEKYVNYYGTVSREISLQEISNSWILLLPLNQAPNIRGRIPGKLFEYIRSMRPIISFGPFDSDVARIINDGEFGLNCEYNDDSELEDFLRDAYKQFKENVFVRKLNIDKIKQYSNYNQTGIVAQHLNEII